MVWKLLALQVQMETTLRLQYILKMCIILSVKSNSSKQNYNIMKPVRVSL